LSSGREKHFRVRPDEALCEQVIDDVGMVVFQRFREPLDGALEVARVIAVRRMAGVLLLVTGENEFFAQVFERRHKRSRWPLN